MIDVLIYEINYLNYVFLSKNKTFYKLLFS